MTHKQLYIFTKSLIVVIALLETLSLSLNLVYKSKSDIQIFESDCRSFK